MLFCGIDPGVHRSAFGIVKDNFSIKGCSFIDSDPKSIAHFIKKYKIAIYIIELPDRIDTKSTVEDILNLTLVVGRFEGLLYNKNRMLVKPFQWKGQTPKDVTQKRVEKKLIGAKKIVNTFSKSIRHNLYDSLGLALYGIEQYG